MAHRHLIPPMQKLPTARGEIAYRRFGNPEGPKVLALHGWLDNHSSFIPLAPFLSELDLIAIDLPGHGSSYHRSDFNTYYFIEWLIDLAEVLTLLGWKRPTLLGHSLGGAIATVWAGTFPETVGNLLLIESLGPLADPANLAPQTVQEFLRQSQRLPSQRSVIYENLETVIALRQKATPLTASSARLLLENSMIKTDSGWVWKSDPRCRFTSALRFTPEQVLAFIHQITCPTLVVIADDGLKLSSQEQAQREKAWQRLEKRSVPGHHHVHMDTPERVAPLLVEFLNSIKKG